MRAYEWKEGAGDPDVDLTHHDSGGSVGLHRVPLPTKGEPGGW